VNGHSDLFRIAVGYKQLALIKLIDLLKESKPPQPFTGIQYLYRKKYAPIIAGLSRPDVIFRLRVLFL